MTNTALRILCTHFAQKCGLLAFAGALLFGQMAYAQTDTAAPFNLYEVNTNDFSKPSAPSDSLTSVSSLIPLTPQESPGSITIFTAEEIKKLGVRDLLDLLNLVPGFYFSGDIEGTTNPGVRGNIAQEAVLLMVDGVEMNELLYGSAPVMNRFAIDQFEKVEVICGPGSAVQGGFATYAVINITTKALNNSRGFNISSLYGRTNDREAHQSTSLSMSTGGYGWQMGMVAGLSRSIAGTGTYKDLEGNCYDMALNNTMLDKFISTYLNYKGLSIQHLGNYYETRNRDSYKTISHGAHNVDFANQDIQLKYHIKFGRNSELIPQLSYTYQQPWFTPSPEHEEDSTTVYFYDRTVQRISGGAILNTAPFKNFKFSLGANHRFDKATNNIPDYPFYDGKNDMKFNVISVFAQVHARTKIANILVGGRFEKHSRFLPVFAPRIAFSRKIGSFNAKIGYTRSYKMPTFENFELSENQSIRPQYTSSTEAEVLYELNNRTEVKLNLFKIDTKSGIAYVLGNDYVEGYDNCGAFATKGLEAGFKTKLTKMDFSASYSFYTNRGENTFRNYYVPGKTVNLAFPAHKVSVVNNLALTKSLRLNTTLLFMSSRYSFNLDSSSANGIYVKHPSTVIVNLFATFRVPIGNGLEAGFGVKDVFDQHIKYIQPYASFHRPLPGIGREFQVRLTYELSNR